MSAKTNYVYPKVTPEEICGFLQEFNGVTIVTSEQAIEVTVGERQVRGTSFIDVMSEFIAMCEPSFTDLTVTRGKYRATFTYINEGFTDDYRFDEDDEPMLRFDVYRKVGRAWEGVSDGTYCTTFNIYTCRKQLKAHLTALVKAYTKKPERGTLAPFTYAP